MTNQKYFIALMIAILGVVWMILRTGENLGSDFEKARLNTDTEMGLNVKSNTFRFAGRPNPAPPSAPKWGSFKSEPTAQAKIEVPKDKNSDLLKGLAKKVADKLKEEKDKKKKKKIADAKKKKKGVTLIKTADSRVSRAMRRLDDGFSSRPQATPVAYGRPPQQGQASPQSAGADEEEQDEVRSYEEWQALLTRSANKEETENLINQYNKEELGDRKWAFMLADEMLASENEGVQEQGAYVLDKIPNETSFTLLVLHRDQHSDKINSAIERSIDGYTAFAKLPILERSARSTTMPVQVQAAKSIELSGQANLFAAQGGRGTRAETGTAQTNAVYLRYQTTVSTLKQISARIPTQTEGKIAIDNTVQRLEEMLVPVSPASRPLDIANQF